jgi:hypothetical protein
MTRRAAHVTKIEVERLIKAVISSGLTVQRVTFDGDHVDVVVGPEKLDRKPARGPQSFATLEEYEAWRAQQPGATPASGSRTFQSLEGYEAWRLKHHGF